MVDLRLYIASIGLVAGIPHFFNDSIKMAHPVSGWASEFIQSVSALAQRRTTAVIAATGRATGLTLNMAPVRSRLPWHTHFIISSTQHGLLALLNQVMMAIH